MSFTKEELVQKFLSGEFKIAHNRRSPTDLSGWTRKAILEKIKTPTCLFPKDFWYLVSFLLSDSNKCSNVNAVDGVNLIVETRSARLHDLIGARGYLVKLEEGDKYWGLTQTGIVQKSMTSWVSYLYTQLITSLITDFIPVFKDADPRLWVIFDVVNKRARIRPNVVYQTTLVPLELLYLQLENRHKNINRTLPDQPGPRIVYPGGNEQHEDEEGPPKKKARKE